LIEWVDAFVDVPGAAAADFRAFWAAVTGWTESGPRGDRGQFRSLLPDPDVAARAYLRVQELDGPPRVHLDLVCAGVGSRAGSGSGALSGEGDAQLALAAERLVALGARPVDDLPGVQILSSPVGQVFCLVTDDEPRQVGPRAGWARQWPGGHRSRLAQVCLDVPPAAYDVELAFWTAVTGWTPKPSSLPEFTHLRQPPDVPLGLLVQRLADGQSPRGAHLDLGTDDIPAEVERLVGLGAVDAGPVQDWHVLRDPVLGLAFCVTPQEP
jgi:hypothetical protein